MRFLVACLVAAALFVVLVARAPAQVVDGTPAPISVQPTPTPQATPTPPLSFAEPAWTYYRETHDLGAVTLHDVYVSAWDEAQQFGYDLGRALECCYSEGYEVGVRTGQEEALREAIAALERLLAFVQVTPTPGPPDG